MPTECRNGSSIAPSSANRAAAFWPPVKAARKSSSRVLASFIVMAFRNTDLAVTHEPVTLHGNADSVREFLDEDRQTALRFGLGRFVLQHIPMFGEDAIRDSHNVHSNPVFRSPMPSIYAVWPGFINLATGKRTTMHCACSTAQSS